MKSSKEIRRIAKHLFRMCFVDGRLDEQKTLNLVNAVVEARPRNAFSILGYFKRLVRLEVEKCSATVETASKITAEMENEARREIGKHYPQILGMRFLTKPELLGGMRIKVGSDVWDGTIQGRLEELKNALDVE